MRVLCSPHPAMLHSLGSPKLTENTITLTQRSQLAKSQLGDMIIRAPLANWSAIHNLAALPSQV